MDNNSVSLDKWRVYFQSANADIFGIIEHAVMVAAIDCPNDFKLRRARIAEMLFTCKVTRCFGCNSVELAMPNADSDEVQEKCKTTGFSREFETCKSKESKMKGGGNDRLEMEMNANQISNCSYGDAEALSDEIEEESQTVAEVLRIKQILNNHEEESESLVIDSLRRLQLMALSVETLKVTDIGKAVNTLRKQESKQIKHLVRALIVAWKAKVDEWVNATETVAGRESTPESVETSAFEEEEEGLPSPPLDEGAFLITNTIELSQFFDDMDDDGNLQSSGEFNENHENGRKTSLENQKFPIRKQELLHGSIAAPQDWYTEQPKEQEAVMKKPSIAAPQDWYTKKPKEQEAVMKKPSIAAPEDWYTKQPKEHETVMKKPSIAAPQDWYTKQPKEQEAVMKKPKAIKPNKLSATGSGSGRLTKQTVGHKVNRNEMRCKVNGNDEMKIQQKSDKATIEKRHAVSQQNLKCPDEDSVQARLEVAKRKLQERHQAHENAKKQQTTQFVEMHNIPKRSLDHKNPYVKLGNYSRQWTNGCQ